MKRFSTLPFVLLVPLQLGSCNPNANESTPPATVTLTIAVAASVQFAMEDLVKEYQEFHPDTLIQATYGSSGNFFAQIKNSAPFDLYFSADMDYPEKLAEEGLALDDQTFPYAVGELVLWVPHTSPIAVEELGIEALKHPSVKKIAIANPQVAPYGAAAVAAMQSLKAYDEAKSKLVYGENISQTAQFVQSFSADIGILALSHVLAPALVNQGRYWLVPPDTFPTLTQGAMILKQTKNAAAARAFLDFVLGETGGDVLNHHGFSLPEK